MEIYPKMKGSECWRHPIFPLNHDYAEEEYEGCWLDMTRPRFREDCMTFDCEGRECDEISAGGKFHEPIWTLEEGEVYQPFFKKNTSTPKRFELLWQLDRLPTKKWRRFQKLGGCFFLCGGILPHLSVRSFQRHEVFTSPVKMVTSTSRRAPVSDPPIVLVELWRSKTRKLRKSWDMW